MVNKAVVGVIGVLLIATLGVGALVGIQGGGGPAEDPNDGSGNGEGPAEETNAEATAAPNESAANATAAPVDDGPTLADREFTAGEIEGNVTERVNAERAARGITALESGEDTTDRNLQEMAREMSALMNDEDVVAHEIGNESIEDRFRRNDLYDTCKFKPPDKSFVAQPGGLDYQFEFVDSTVVETTFDEDRGVRYHEYEEAVADAIVDEWLADLSEDDGFLSSNFGKMGVGVEVRQDGTVFATLHLCGA